jgi:outer membrane protein assembly factor BamB
MRACTFALALGAASLGAAAAAAGDGAMRWAFASGARRAPVVSSTSTVYLATGTAVYAVDAAGGELWEAPTSSQGCDPVLSPLETVLVTGLTDPAVGVSAYDAATGALVWTAALPDSATGLGFAPDGSLVFAASQDGSVTALSALDGGVGWTWSAGTGSSVHCPPLVDPAAGILYVGTDDGHLVAIAVGNGSTLWTYPPAGAAGEIHALAFDPTASTVLFGTWNVTDVPFFYSVSADSGLEAWAVQTDDTTREPLAVDATKGVVYAGGLTTLFALKISDGTVFGSKASPTGGEVSGVAVDPVRGLAYAATHDGTVVCVRTTTKLPTQWSYVADSDVRGGVALTPDAATLYAASQGFLYSFCTGNCSAPTETPSTSPSPSASASVYVYVPGGPPDGKTITGIVLEKRRESESFVHRRCAGGGGALPPPSRGAAVQGRPRRDRHVAAALLQPRRVSAHPRTASSGGSGGRRRHRPV